FPSVPCHTYSHSCFCLFSRAAVFSLSVQMGSNPERLQEDQAAHSRQWGCYAADHPAAGRLEPYHPTWYSGTTRGCRPTTCPLDPIPSNILQAIGRGCINHLFSPAVLPAITQVINASFNSGTFPSLFKVARVTPLLKKPSLDPTQVENYRPVSLLTLLSKTIERAASKQVTEFL